MIESAQWVIAISTAVIAVVFLALGAFLLRAFCLMKTLEKTSHALINSVEQRSQDFGLSLRKIFFTPSNKDPHPEEGGGLSRVGRILQGAVLVTALWKTIKKRR